MAFLEKRILSLSYLLLPLMVVSVCGNDLRHKSMKKRTTILTGTLANRTSGEMRAGIFPTHHTTRTVVKMKQSDSYLKVKQSTDHVEKDGFIDPNLMPSNDIDTKFKRKGASDPTTEEDVYLDIGGEKSGIEKKPDSGHGNLFRCPPCNCSHTKAQKKIADCVSLNLTKMPETLPRDVWVINMSSNFLHTFNASSILMYSNLITLDLSNNSIHNVYVPVATNSASNLTWLNLNNNIINYIQNDSLCNMRKLRTLTLKNNSLTHIGKTTFICQQKLHLLDLSKNMIKEIDDTAFDNLYNLENLFLDGNSELGYAPTHFGHRIVKNLQRLKKLHIQGNSRRAIMYPNELLGALTNLQELFVDGLGGNAEFGPQLRTLGYLKTLSFGPHATCDLKNLSHTFFNNTPHLTSLTFDGCIFESIDHRAFQYIPHLENYAIKPTTNDYNLQRAFTDVSMLNTYNSSLRSLSFVQFRDLSDPCNVLSYKQGKYIKNMKLESLDLGINNIVLIQNDFLHCIPKTLKILNLRRNRFTLSGNLWGRMPFLKHLRELDVSDQQMDEWRPKYLGHSYVPHTFLKQVQVNDEIDRKRGNWYDDQKSSFAVPNVCRKTKLKNRCPSHSNGKLCTIAKRLQLPPKLEKVDATFYLFFAGVLLFHELSENSLTYLNFSNNFLPDWGCGYLPRTVETADFSNNQCFHIHAAFFPPQNKLVSLFIQNNVLGPAFSNDTNGTILSKLCNLYHLDISMNTIFKLPTNFFIGLKKLRSLNMNQNKLYHLDVHLSHLQYLTYVDASKNSIAWISKKTRDDLDELARRSDSKTITLDLTDNPLPCTCDGLEILLWINDSNVFFINHAFLKCTYSNGSKAFLSDIPDMIRALRYECTNHIDFIVGTASSLSGLFIAFLTIVFLYKKRWRLLYFINNGVLVRMFGFQPHGEPNSNKYKFDAYVVYDEEDRDFVLGQFLEEIEKKRGHQVCVGDRDFLPGTYNFNNINSAVQNSAVTLLLISYKFIQADEFRYVMEVSLREEYYNQARREACHLILYDQLSSTDLPRELQMLVVKNRFIAYPHTSEVGVNAEVYQGFWDRLSLYIGQTSRHEVIETRPLLQSD